LTSRGGVPGGGATTRRDTPGHLPEHQDDAATAGWRTTQPLPLDLDAPVIEVDTSNQVDVGTLAAQILSFSRRR
jgi:hypothetical protein